MKNTKIGFLQEEEGVNSSTRLIFVIGSFFFMLVTGGLLFYKNIDPILGAVFFSMIQGVLWGYKSYKSSLEIKQKNLNLKTTNMQSYVFTYVDVNNNTITVPIYASTPEEAWTIFESTYPGIHPTSGPKKSE